MKYTLKSTIALAVLFSSLFVSGQILNEDFENSSFPPLNWTLTQTNSSETWVVDSKNSKSGIKSAVVNYDKSLGAQNEILISPTFDLTTVTDPYLDFEFSMSYFWSVSPNNNYDFKVSVNDGVNSTVVWTENNEGNFEDYTWRSAKIDLKAYAGKSNLKLEFSYVGTDGATLNFDDVKVSETAVLGVDDVGEVKSFFYSNPVKDLFSFQSKKKIDELAMYNTLGQIVYQSKSKVSQIDMSSFNKGLYFLKVRTEEVIQTYKILKE